MTYLWGGMLIIGIVFGALNGNLQEVTEAVISSSKEAVALCISMAGITAMWTGIMKIAENTGLVSLLSRGMKPVLRFLFPDISPESQAGKYISLNFLSNILGLSWASTSSGLCAVRELQKLNEEDCKRRGVTKKRAPHIASTAMCTFMIINVSSLQLLPMNMIAYRAQYGSVNPAAVVGPGIVATAVSTGMAVVFCKIAGKRKD
ncbi:MAG: nucleoside recognition protein [Blautia sp.]